MVGTVENSEHLGPGHQGWNEENLMEDWNAWTGKLQLAWRHIVKENNLAATCQNRVQLIGTIIGCISLEAGIFRLRRFGFEPISTEEYMIFMDSFLNVTKKIRQIFLESDFLTSIYSTAEVVADSNEINKFLSTEQADYREKIAPHLEGMNENEYVDFVRSRLIGNESEAERLVLNYILRQYEHFEDPRFGPEATINDALQELIENWQSITVGLPEDMRHQAIELMIQLSTCLRIHLEIIKTDTSVIQIMDSQSVHDFMEVYTTMRKEFRKLHAAEDNSAGIILYRLKNTMDELFSTV